MVRKIGANLSGLEVPQITDYSASNFKGVMDATMQGYKSAMEAVEAKVKVDQNNYSRQVRDIQVKEANRVAAYNQQGKGSGQSVASGLAELGSSLVAGYIGMEQMQAKKKQAELEMQMKMEDQQMQRESHAMKKEDFLAQRRAMEEKQRIETLMAPIEMFNQDLENQVLETISQASATEGIAVGEALVDEFLTSPQFDALSPNDRFFITQKVRGKLTQLRKDHLDGVVGEKNALKDSTTQQAISTAQMTTSSLIKGLETEFVPTENVQDTITQIFTESHKVLQQPEFRMIASDPQLFAKFQTEMIKQIGASMDVRYRNMGERAVEAQRWVQAAQDVASLEALASVPVEQGGISSYDYQVLSKQLMIELGVPGDPNSLPTAQINLREDEIKKQEQNIRLTEFQERERFTNPMVNSPEYQAAQRFGVSSIVHDAINGRGRGLEGTIDHYESLKAANPQQYRAEQGGAIIDLLEGYRSDQTRMRQLNKDAADIEKQLAALDFKINPMPFKEVVIPAGTPLGTLGGFTAKPEVRIIETPERLPQANAEEAEALKRKLQQVDLERQDILYNYAQYGINVEDPRDTQYLLRLDEETRAARQYVEEQMRIQGGSSVTPSSSGNLAGQQEEPLPKTPTRPTVSSRISELEQNMIRMSRTGTVQDVPKNEAPSAPALPMKNQLVKAKWGYTPFLGGSVTMTSDMGMRNHPVRGGQKMHNGIDIVSSDPRVGSIQGGTVERVYKPSESGGYGNAITIRTPDGRVEFFGHLKSVAVSQGDKIAPGHQIGIMGSTGVSTGDHLHFEVWKAGTKVDTWGKGFQEDPKDYMSMVTVKLPQPSGQGNLPSGSPSSSLYTTNDEIVTNTGMMNLGGSLRYVRGRIFDVSTGRFRNVTPADAKLIERGVPMTRTVSSNYQVRTSNMVQPDDSIITATDTGSKITSGYRIPDGARQQKTFLFLSPTGRRTGNGLPIFALRAFKDNKQVFAVEAVSGRSDFDGVDRHVAGKEYPLPDGEYSVARNSVPGDQPAVGKTFWGTSPKFSTGRSALGIHYDADQNGTAGCLGVRSLSDYAKVEDFLKRHPGLAMHVNTKPEQQLAVKGATTTPQGRPQANYSGNLDISKASYGENLLTSNYGYNALKKNSSWASSLKKGADKAGVPAVWVADLIASESDWQAGVDNGVGYAGFIQFGDAAAKDIAKELGYKDWQSWTRNRILRQGANWQLEVAVPTYFKVTERYAGKKIQTIEDLVAAVWGGASLLKKSAKQRAKENISDGWVDWFGKLKQVQDKSPGRSYRWTHTKNSTYHMNPRSGCKICNSMVHSGNFVPHKHDMNNFNYA